MNSKKKLLSLMNEEDIDEILKLDFNSDDIFKIDVNDGIDINYKMSEEEEVHSRLGSLANCLDYKYKEELTNEILSVDWSNYENAKKMLDKYLDWLIDPIEYPVESRNETKLYLEKALANPNYDFQGVVDEAEMAFDETAQGDPRKVFEAIYKYICENE